MQPKTWIVGFALALVCIGKAATAQSNGAWDVVVNGRSHHIDAAYQWNEDNYGLGVEREFATTSRWIKVALGNTFMDSMNNPSYMAGGGLKRRFRFGSGGYVDLGGVAFLMTRENVNGDKPFPGLLPAATFGFKRIALNVTYMPESVVDSVTNSHRYDPTMKGVFFLQLKLDAALFSPASNNRQWLAHSR